MNEKNWLKTHEDNLDIRVKHVTDKETIENMLKLISEKLKVCTENYLFEGDIMNENVYNDEGLDVNPNDTVAYGTCYLGKQDKYEPCSTTEVRSNGYQIEKLNQLLNLLTSVTNICNAFESMKSINGTAIKTDKILNKILDKIESEIETI